MGAGWQGGPTGRRGCFRKRGDRFCTSVARTLAGQVRVADEGLVAGGMAVVAGVEAGVRERAERDAYVVRTASEADVPGARAVMLDTVYRDLRSGYVPRWHADII